jgi:pimeloyl-ACP methyl ester carboxylesterase
VNSPRTVRLPTTLVAALAALSVVATPQAFAADHVQFADGSARVEADPNSEEGAEDESDTLPFHGSVSGGAASARQDTTIIDVSTGISIHSVSHVTGANLDYGYSVLERRFTVTGDAMAYRLSGSTSDSLSGASVPEDAVQGVELTRVDTGGTGLFEHSDADGDTFSTAGTLPPGTYQLVAHGSCEPGAGTTCTGDLDVTLEVGDPEPPPEPVIFVHGFLGSQIYCGTQELWPNMPSPRLPEMDLSSDGSTNAGCPSAGPQQGVILESALGRDVYGSTISFLRGLAPTPTHLYAWDWRKDPQEALAGLDALIDQVRPGDGKVVLMAHSMGGLVVREYIEDAARARKVARAVTVATPYWGSPKALFPFLYGVEAPGFSGLDIAFDDDELREFARYLQGLFFLWPSANYGPWLSIQGRPSPLGEGALLDFVDERGGNRALLANALGSHAMVLDELRANGVDYQVMIGTKVHTIGAVSIAETIAGGQGDPAAMADLVTVDWVNGDGTVPVVSAEAATPPERRHYACGINHVPIPGEPTVTSRLRAFLLDADAPIVAGGGPCEADGYAISLYTLDGGVFASQAAPGSSLSFAEAEEQGRLEMLSTGRQIEAATSTTDPLTLALRTRGAALRIAPMKNGRRGRARVYGPVKKGRLTIRLAGRVTVKRNGKTVKPRKNDTRAPKTRVRVRRMGRRAILALAVRDASPVTTYVKMGKHVRRVKGRRLRVPLARLRRRVTVQSIDAFGNVERPKRVRPNRG